MCRELNARNNVHCSHALGEHRVTARLLSLAPHQEPRFLTPLIVPLCALEGFTVSTHLRRFDDDCSRCGSRSTRFWRVFSACCTKAVWCLQSERCRNRSTRPITARCLSARFFGRRTCPRVGFGAIARCTESSFDSDLSGAAEAIRNPLRLHSSSRLCRRRHLLSSERRIHRRSHRSSTRGGAIAPRRIRCVGGSAALAFRTLSRPPRRRHRRHRGRR